MEDILLPNRVGELPSPLPAARGACCVSNYLPYAPLRNQVGERSSPLPAAPGAQKRPPQTRQPFRNFTSVTGRFPIPVIAVLIYDSQSSSLSWCGNLGYSCQGGGIMPGPSQHSPALCARQHSSSRTCLFSSHSQSLSGSLPRQGLSLSGGLLQGFLLSSLQQFSRPDGHPQQLPRPPQQLSSNNNTIQFISQMSPYNKFTISYADIFIWCKTILPLFHPLCPRLRHRRLLCFISRDTDIHHHAPG